MAGDGVEHRRGCGCSSCRVGPVESRCLCGHLASDHEAGARTCLYVYEVEDDNAFGFVECGCKWFRPDHHVRPIEET